MKKVDWDSIGVFVFLLITFICKLFSCVLHGVYAFQDGRRGLSTSENMLFLPWEGRLLRARRAYIRMQNVTRWFLVGYILGCRRWYMRILRVVSLVGCKDFSSFCWLLSGREVVWEVMPVGLLVWGVGRFFFHVGEFLLSQRVFLSLTELTDLTEHICALFRTHRRPPAYRVHRALLLKVAVRFCDIGWLNVSVECCVFCSSVFFCEK